MSAALLTADWFLLGRDLYFRKFEIYSMGWQQNVNLEDCIVAAAPYGGPIAVRRNEQKFTKVKKSGHPIIAIYSCSGKQLAFIKWTKNPLIEMGWSNDEKLICVQNDGKVVLHDLFGKFIKEFGINLRIPDKQIISAKIFTSPQNFTGIAVMTSSFNIFLVNNINEPKIRQLSELPRSSLEPNSWIVISEEPQAEVLISRSNELYRLKQDEHHTSVMLEPDIQNKWTGIIDMAISFNARHVVFYTDSGILWLGSSNLRSKYCEIETNVFYKPKQLVWCGTEAVVVYWEQNNTVLVAGRHGEKVTFIYDGMVNLIVEIDCVRILSPMQHELLQKVPDVVQKIFRINSTDPASFLLEASKQFQKRSHRANEYISLVKNNLLKAVEQCIEAVGYEFDTNVQKMLIRAAQFGKCFLGDTSSVQYVNMCRLLRVLNAVRDQRIGIPLTILQLKYLTEKVLLERLVARRQYYLAIQIAHYLKIPDKDGKSRILVHWAKYKVAESQAEEEVLAREIANKLGHTSGISYSDIATTASECGKKKLAVKLLDYECKASEQVKLLLELCINKPENSPALVKAIESGDTDQVYTVILKFREKMPFADFKMTISNNPTARALYIKYCREHNSQALNEIYIQDDDFNSQAQSFIIESLDANKIITNDSTLTSALEAYKKARSDLNASMCEENLRLLKHQREFEEKLKESFVGKTIHDTCKQLLNMNEIKLADKFRSEYKIPDKRYWWLRIQSLAHKEEWAELEKFSKIKKSPIGYAPFVDVCLQKHNKSESSKYLPKVNDDIKVKYYVKAELYEEAAKIAFEQRDIQSLFYVQSKCIQNSNLCEKINNLILQLGAKK